MTIEVKEAVRIAKTYVRELFADESVKHVGLEQTEWDERERAWKMTIGFSRPWDNAMTRFGLESPMLTRNYKTVEIDEEL